MSFGTVALFAIGFCLVLGFLALLISMGKFDVRSISEDELTLESPELGLSGRPDRLIRIGKAVIPVDDKNSDAVYPSTRVQIGAYLMLAEERFGTRPGHGQVVLANGKTERVPNTARLRRDVLRHLRGVQAIHANPGRRVRSRATPAQCQRCDVRGACTIRRA